MTLPLSPAPAPSLAVPGAPGLLPGPAGAARGPHAGRTFRGGGPAALGKGGSGGRGSAINTGHVHVRVSQLLGNIAIKQALVVFIVLPASPEQLAPPVWAVSLLHGPCFFLFFLSRKLMPEAVQVPVAISVQPLGRPCPVPDGPQSVRGIRCRCRTPSGEHSREYRPLGCIQRHDPGPHERNTFFIFFRPRACLSRRDRNLYPVRDGFQAHATGLRGPRPRVSQG